MSRQTRLRQDLETIRRVTTAAMNTPGVCSNSWSPYTLEHAPVMKGLAGHFHKEVRKWRDGWLLNVGHWLLLVCETKGLIPRPSAREKARRTARGVTSEKLSPA